MIDTGRWGDTPAARPRRWVVVRVRQWQLATRGVNALRRSPLPTASHTQHLPRYCHNCKHDPRRRSHTPPVSTGNPHRSYNRGAHQYLHLPAARFRVGCARFRHPLWPPLWPPLSRPLLPPTPAVVLQLRVSWRHRNGGNAGCCRRGSRLIPDDGATPQWQGHAALTSYVYTQGILQREALTLFAGRLCLTLATHSTCQGIATTASMIRGGGRKHHQSQRATRTIQTREVHTKICT